MLNNRITTLKERLTCFIAHTKKLLIKLAYAVSWSERKDEPDASLALLHEKIDALAEYQGIQFYKPKMKDYMGNDVLDVFKARKRAKR